MPKLTNISQSPKRLEDTLHASGDPGIMALVVRSDAGGTLVDVDGDYAPLQVNAAGLLRVTAVGAAGGTSMVDDTAFTVEVDTFTPAGGILDDVAPDSVDEGDGGVFRMSANRNQYVQIRDDAGAERGLNIDAAGALTAQANIRDGAGVALTSTLVGADQSLDVNVVATVGAAGGTSMVDDAAFTPGTTPITPAGAMFDDVAPDSVNEGDGGVVRMSANRNMYMTLRDAAGNERGLNVDAGGLIGVTDGGGTLTVDDGGLSLSVDDAGGTLTVDDGGLSLTVDNAALTVVGGGAEATALRVTIANDSTGLVSVDDGGVSLSVDDAGGSLTVDNAALTVVGGGAEATAQRVTIANDSTGVVTVDDGGASLTVDNPALSVVGGGAEATAQRVTIANDSTGVLSVDDNGGALSVDDNGGSLTVDNAALAVVGGGAEATALRVTIANDSTGLLSVDDNGASLTVDNAALSVVGGGAEATALRVTIANDSTGVVTVDNTVLSVVGGGAEATAQRVTIANDSTGVLSVDDNGGSLTVDGTVTASNTAGDVADDAGDSGNPVKIGGVAVETDGTDPTSVTAEGDRAEVRTDLNRRLLVNIVHPNLWSTNDNWAAAQTDTAIKAAPGANLSLYITDVTVSTEGVCNVTLVRNTAASVDIFGPMYFAANGGIARHFSTPIRLPANENLGVTSSAAVNHTVSVQGYTAP